MTTLALGQILEVTAERLAFGGAAIARHDGLTLFVPFAAPGDQLRVEITELDKRHGKARIVEVLRAGPHRRAPRCRHYQDCGGCHLQHLDYQEQVRQKAAFVRDALVRTGGFDWPGAVRMHTADEWGYRSRTQLKVHDRQVGFHRMASNEIVEIEECPVMAPGLAAALPTLRTALAAMPDRRHVHQLEGACGHDGSAWAPDLPGMRKDLVEHRVLDFRYFVEPESFFQGNRLLVDALVRHATAGARGGLAFDLYAGVGLFSLPLSRRFERVVAVEDERRAATLGRVNCKQNGCDNVHFHRQTTEQFLRANRERPEFVLIDPPRQGAKPAIAQLLQLLPRQLVYVSCDPNTMARDLRALCDGGFAITSVESFDMFPQTYHVESVAHLHWRQP